MCMGIGLSVLWAVTYEIDQAKGTGYHQRFREFFKEVQKKDLRFALGIMDPKGDRSLSPGKQPDPDLHLRVVEKRADGIVVNGAKAHTTSAPCTHVFFAAPCRVLGEKDRDYAVSFAVPVDTKGLTFITRPAAGPLEPKEIENPVSSQIGFVECLSVFDNVFVPWERVFMCGEWEATNQLINYFSSYARLAKCACTSARLDILAGAAALIAEYNGVEKAGHIRHKITEMMITSEIGWGCANGGVARSSAHPSGVSFPDVAMCSAGLYHIRTRFSEFLGTLQEIAGGLVTTMPTEADYKNPQTRPWIEKYLRGKAGVPTENRFRLLHLIQDLTASRFTGYLLGSVVCAAGTPETNRIDVIRNYDLEGPRETVKAWAGIKD